MKIKIKKEAALTVVLRTDVYRAKEANIPCNFEFEELVHNMPVRR